MMNVCLDSLEEIVKVAVNAGDIIMPYYRGEKDIGVDVKTDESPVTLADQEAEQYIIQELEGLFPNIQIVAEEKAAAGDIPVLSNDEMFFLVDPLDGTKEFIHNRDEFTVNIALIQYGKPIMGVVYAPALDDIYAGIDGEGAYFMSSRSVALGDAQMLNIEPKTPVVAVASRSHMSDETQQFLDENGISDFISAGSSLKFCMVASGKADIYPRFGRTMEWDTAAGDAVVRAAGGRTVTVDNVPLRYGKQGRENDSDFANPFFIVKS
ncbi:MAG: 3'(2'),5'-bisphosphate nucleotidase CysQ [Alphaproteobacteria bacterium]